MALTQQQIENFVRKAKATGYSDEEIAAEIARKERELSGGAGMDVSSPTISQQPEPEMDIGGEDIFAQPEEKKGFLQGGFLSKVSDTLSIPSYLLGGAQKASREQLTGEYQAPETGLKFNITPIAGKDKGVKKEVDVGRFLHPTLVGAYRGIKNRESMFEETPKTASDIKQAFGGEPIEEGNIGGLFIGFGAELLTPDLTDAIAGFKAVKGAKGKVVTKIDDIINWGAKRLALKGLKPTKTQLRVFKEVTRKELGDFVLDNKLFTRSVDEVDDVIKPAQDVFDSIAAASGRKVTKDDLYQRFLTKIDELSAEAAPELRNKAKAIDEYASNLLNKWGDEIDVADITKERRKIDQLVSKFKDDLTRSKNQSIREILSETVEYATKDITVDGKNLDEIGNNLNELYLFRKIVKEQEGLGKGGNLISWTRLGGGLMGSTFGGSDPSEDPVGAALNFLKGFGLVSLANSPKFVSKVAELMTSPTTAKIISKGTKVAKKGAIVAGREDLGAPSPEVQKEMEDVINSIDVGADGSVSIGGVGGTTPESGNIESDMNTGAMQFQQPQTITGHTIDEHLQALSRAVASNDKAAENQIRSQLSIEQDYQNRKTEKAKPVKKTQDQINRESMGYSVDKALSLIKTNPDIKTGFIASPLEEFKSTFNRGDPETIEFNRIISELKGDIAKARGGTAFTPNEERLLNRYSPKIGDSKQQLLTKLINLKQKIEFFSGTESTGSGVQFQGGSSAF